MKILPKFRWIQFLALITIFSYIQREIGSTYGIISNNRTNLPPISDKALILSPQQATAIAMNDFHDTGEGIYLSNPGYEALFGSEGLSFAPRTGEMTWKWQLTGVYFGEKELAGVEVHSVLPMQSSALQIDYPRGALIERYIAHPKNLEQQFIITIAPPVGYGDLVIEGEVRTEGDLESYDRGWIWRVEDTLVSLGQVRVYDSTGQEIPASMQTDEGKTRIVLDGNRLATAAYPVTVDPEIGTNDFRISSMGIDILSDVSFSDVAYNSTTNEFLIVWSADNLGGTGDDKQEIYGQRVDAGTGAEISPNDFKISDMFTNFNDPNYDAINPAVAFNSTNNDYLVVWSGEDVTDGEFEIHGQRISAAGVEIGTNDFRISVQGVDGDTLITAGFPDVAYNSTNNEYLVVWHGDGGPGTLNEEYEIYVQRLNAATGAEVGSNDLRITDVGGLNEANFDAQGASVAYNSNNNEYLVIWQGDDDAAGSAGSNDIEIYGQRLAGATAAEVGANDFLLSDLGTAGSTSFGSQLPALAYNSRNNEYLVVWFGDDDTLGLADNELEIFAQRVNASTGAQVGTNDFRLSSMGPDNNANFDAGFPDVSYSSDKNLFLVIWEGDDNVNGLVDGEKEIFGQLINGSNGAELGTDDFRISEAGTDGLTNYSASLPGIGYSNSSQLFLVDWNADDDAGPSGVADDEFEILGQRIDDTLGTLVGENDYRFSSAGISFGVANQPAVAYNSTDDEYLVVWLGTDNHPGQEIYTQRLDGATGQEIGTNDLRITDLGEDAQVASEPEVVYNPTNQEYLVVWIGDDISGGLGEVEVFGQRLDASTGAEVGADDFRISDMGAENDFNYFPANPSLAYNSVNNEYLVVWEADNDFGALVNNEFDIWGQRLNAATGAEVGTNDFRISAMGPDGNTSFIGQNPAVAYNSTNNQYLVVWQGVDSGFVAGETEIFGQLLKGVDCTEIGIDDFMISTVGPSANASFDGFNPELAYNAADNQFLVVWDGTYLLNGVTNIGREIWGQRLDASTGAEVGGDDFRISEMGVDGAGGSFFADDPDVNYLASEHEFFVVWSGSDDIPGLAAGEVEIYGQRIGASGNQIGGDERLSDMGPDGTIVFGTALPAVISGSGNKILVAWEGDDNKAGVVDQAFEIFGQFLVQLQNLYLPVVFR